MDKQHYVIAIIVRLAAILLFLKGLGFLPNWYFAYSSEQLGLDVIAFSLFFCVLIFGGAIFLWKFPLTIARHITPVGEFSDELKDSSLGRLQTALLSVFGIGLVIYTAPTLIFKFTYLHHLKLTSDPGYPSDDFYLYVGLYQALLELLLGVWLALGSKSIVQFVNKLRHADTTE